MKFLIQFLSNTPVYIALVSALELLLDVSYFSWHTSLWGYHWRDERLVYLIVFQLDLWHDMHHNMLEGIWNIPYFCWFYIPCFEITLVGAFISFINVLSWVNGGFIWMVHEILHVMFDIKKIMFCWFICVATEVHCKILKVIASLNSDFHESTNPVIEWSSMWFINLFQLFSNDRYSHE